MLSEMDRDTLMYWIAFLNIKKGEHDLKDYQIALLTKVVAEMFGKGSGKPLSFYLLNAQSEQDRLNEQDELNRRFMDKLPIFQNTIIKE